MGHRVRILFFKGGKRRTVRCVPSALKRLYCLVSSWSVVNFWVWISSSWIAILRAIQLCNQYLNDRIRSRLIHHTHYTLIEKYITNLYHSTERCRCPILLCRYHLSRFLFISMILISLLLFTYNQSYAKSYHVFVSSSKSRRRVYTKGTADNRLLHIKGERIAER